MTNATAGACAIFTVCNLAYLPRALVLADSVRQHTGQTLTIVLFDRRTDLPGIGERAHIEWIEELGVPGFSRLAFKYDVTELSTSLKPFLALRLLDRVERVVFFDPDICLYDSLEPVLADLAVHSVLLTPHYTTPQSNDRTESDLAMMRFGSFNLGFFAVRRSEDALAFLRWWSDRCIQFCFFETQFGLSTDQKWVSIAPCLFTDLMISRNLGYNVAYWNAHERRLASTVGGGLLVNDEFPLIFFHFSNFDATDPGYLRKRSVRQRDIARPELTALGEAYGRAVAANAAALPAVRYAYDYMSGGEYVSPTLRRAYASIEDELPADHDPFDSGGAVAAFARRNHLFEPRHTPYRVQGYADIAQHSGTFQMIYRLMRIVLRVVGPNRFYNLSRLLVYLSSYRQNRGLWKY